MCVYIYIYNERNEIQSITLFTVIPADYHKCVINIPKPTIRYIVNSLLLPFILLYAQGRHEPEASIVYQLWQSSLHPIKWTMEYYEQSPKVLQWKYCGDDTA